MARSLVGPDGLIADASVRDRILDVLREIVRHVTTADAS